MPYHGLTRKRAHLFSIFSAWSATWTKHVHQRLTFAISGSVGQTPFVWARNGLVTRWRSKKKRQENQHEIKCEAGKRALAHFCALAHPLPLGGVPPPAAPLMINGDGRLVSGRERAGKPRIDNPTCFTFRPPCWVRRVRWGGWVKHLTECRMWDFSPPPLPSLAPSHWRVNTKSNLLWWRRPEQQQQQELPLPAFISLGKLRPIWKKNQSLCRTIGSQLQLRHSASYHARGCRTRRPLSLFLCICALPRPLGCRREDVEHKGRSWGLMQKKRKRRSSDRYYKLNLPSNLLNGVFRHLWQVHGCAASGRRRLPVLKFSLASTFPSLIQAFVRTPNTPPKKITSWMSRRARGLHRINLEELRELSAWIFF